MQYCWNDNRDGFKFKIYKGLVSVLFVLNLITRCFVDIWKCFIVSLFWLLIVQGFDEYMNLVLDEAEEVSIKKNTRKPLGELFGTLHNRFFYKTLVHIPYIVFCFRNVWFLLAQILDFRKDLAKRRQHNSDDERVSSFILFWSFLFPISLKSALHESKDTNFTIRLHFLEMKTNPSICYYRGKWCNSPIADLVDHRLRIFELSRWLVDLFLLKIDNWFGVFLTVV